jgi:hypothetical protein
LSDITYWDLSSSSWWPPFGIDRLAFVSSRIGRVLIVSEDVTYPRRTLHVTPDLQQYNGKPYMTTYSQLFFESDFGSPDISQISVQDCCFYSGRLLSVHSALSLLLLLVACTLLWTTAKTSAHYFLSALLCHVYFHSKLSSISILFLLIDKNCHRIPLIIWFVHRHSKEN